MARTRRAIFDSVSGITDCQPTPLRKRRAAKLVCRHLDAFYLANGRLRTFRSSALTLGNFHLQDFGLILEQSHDHAERHEVLRKVPNHMVAGDVHVQRGAKFRDREDQSPGQKGERSQQDARRQAPEICPIVPSRQREGAEQQHVDSRFHVRAHAESMPV